MIYVYHAALAATVFLVTLNGFLRGSKKAQIDAVLGVILVGLLVIGFVAFGWIVGVLALILAFVYARISRPLAAATATRLFSAGGGHLADTKAFRIASLSVSPGNSDGHSVAV